MPSEAAPLTMRGALSRLHLKQDGGDAAERQQRATKLEAALKFHESVGYMIVIRLSKYRTNPMKSPDVVEHERIHSKGAWKATSITRETSQLVDARAPHLTLCRRNELCTVKVIRRIETNSQTAHQFY